MRVWDVEQDRNEFAEFYAAARDDCLRIVLISAGDERLAEDLVAEADFRKCLCAGWPGPVRGNDRGPRGVDRAQSGIKRAGFVTPG